MKIFFSFLFVCLCSVIHAQFAPQNLQQIADREKQAYASGNHLMPLVSISDYDIKYHRCEWQVDPAVNYIKGEITTYFTPLAANFDSILFNLSDTLKVDSVKYHNAAMAFVHANNIVTIILPSVIPVGTLDSVSVYYQGAPYKTGFGSFVDTTHNGVPIIWTLSEPYGASDWWPCKNSLTDKADSIDVIVTSPSAYRAASNGLLVAETISGANRICHWKHRYPIATYLICFAVTNYVKYECYVPFASTNLLEQSYVYPEDSASVAAQTPADIPIMQLYDTLFGVYPFINEKYGHVEAGMSQEHQTMTFFGETSFGFETLAHELGHHWFGDKITCASWRDIWLNEGFATYLSGLCYERMLGGVWWMPFKSGRMQTVTSLPSGSVWCDDTTNVNRIFDSRLSYAKGAMILHQLRWIIGDSAFFAALNNYLNDPNLAYGFAHTSDLQNHFQIASGQNLNWYFNDWFTGQGFPSYQINWNQNNDTVNLTVNQTQSDPSVSFFALPLPVEFKNASNDTIVRLQNNFSGQTFSVHIPFQVDSVKLDPELWIITANNSIASVSENELSKSVSIFPNPSTGKIQVQSTKSLVLSLEIYNVLGEEIYTMDNEKLKMHNGNTLSTVNSSLSIDLSSQPQGIYLLKIKFKDGVVNRKLVVE